MTNKQYINPETATTWTDSSGTLAMTLANLSSGAVRIGAQLDRGAGARAEWYEWRIVIAGFATPPVVGQSVNLHFARSDGTDADSDVGTGDAAGAVDDIPNFLAAGRAKVRSTTAADNIGTSGIVRIASRYISPVLHNATDDDLQNTSNVHKIILIPIPPEIQDAP